MKYLHVHPQSNLVHHHRTEQTSAVAISVTKIDNKLFLTSSRKPYVIIMIIIMIKKPEAATAAVT